MFTRQTLKIGLPFCLLCERTALGWPWVKHHVYYVNMPNVKYFSGVLAVLEFQTFFKTLKSLKNSTF